MSPDSPSALLGTLQPHLNHRVQNLHSSQLKTRWYPLILPPGVTNGRGPGSDATCCRWGWPVTTLPSHNNAPGLPRALAGPGGDQGIPEQGEEAPGSGSGAGSERNTRKWSGGAQEAEAVDSTQSHVERVCPMLVDASRTEFSAGSSTIRDGQPLFIPQTAFQSTCAFQPFSTSPAQQGSCP